MCMRIKVLIKLTGNGYKNVLILVNGNSYEYVCVYVPAHDEMKTTIPT